MKKYREDLNRHIPQNINELASLALADLDKLFTY